MPSDNARRGPVRVLVTGAGGPAAVAVMKSLRHDPDVQLLAADMDPWAAGLYLVQPEARTVIPPGLQRDFAEIVRQRCVALEVDVLIPTVDCELRPLAAAREAFASCGVALLLTSDRTLGLTLDKLALARCCAGVARVPRTEPLDGALDPAGWTYPVIVKPRTGSGSRGIGMIASAGDLAAAARASDEDMIVQEYLPGQEYSVDVLADEQGRVVSAVPRVRERVDSGVSVAGRTLHDPELEQLAAAVAGATGLTFIANVQCRRDQAGRPALLEVNPRAPGALPLTVASGVDMPRLALDALRGAVLPDHLDFTEMAMVRFLDERFVGLSEIEAAAAA
jgi:carbamoyl-phosphate synthase large subunit